MCPYVQVWGLWSIPGKWVGCCRWCDGNPEVQLKVGLEHSEGEGEAATPPSQSQVEVAL